MCVSKLCVIKKPQRDSLRPSWAVASQKEKKRVSSGSETYRGRSLSFRHHPVSDRAEFCETLLLSDTYYAKKALPIFSTDNNPKLVKVNWSSQTLWGNTPISHKFWITLFNFGRPYQLTVIRKITAEYISNILYQLQTPPENWCFIVVALDIQYQFSPYMFVIQYWTVWYLLVLDKQKISENIILWTSTI